MRSDDDEPAGLVDAAGDGDDPGGSALALAGDLPDLPRRRGRRPARARERMGQARGVYADEYRSPLFYVWRRELIAERVKALKG